jgi:hypothetical protein
MHHVVVFQLFALALRAIFNPFGGEVLEFNKRFCYGVALPE